MMECSIKKNDKESTLTLSGDLEVSQAKELYDEIQKCRAHSPNLCLNLEGVTSIDVAMLQLICSTHRSYIVDQRNLRLQNISQQTFETISLTGFLREKGCRFDKDGQCLWTMRR